MVILIGLKHICIASKVTALALLSLGSHANYFSNCGVLSCSSNLWLGHCLSVLFCVAESVT